MSSRPKKKRYSLEEVEDMLMNDPDSGDSDLDLGEDFAALDIESNRDEESENHNNNNEMESEYEESDNEISFRSMFPFRLQKKIKERLPNNPSALDYFRLYFTNRIVDHMVTETNRYAE